MKKTGKFIWKDKQATISQCIACKHLNPGAVCTAFPDGIPMKIKTNEHDHKKPYRGDGGIRFESI